MGYFSDGAVTRTYPLSNQLHLADQSHADLARRKLGPYEIVAPIGKGGMAEVWKARDPRLGRDVATKVPAEQFGERFERESRAVAALNHPNICTLYYLGPDYLVMEYIEGTVLKGPLPLDQALRYATQICEALDAAHQKGVIHRDLKLADLHPGGVKRTAVPNGHFLA